MRGFLRVSLVVLAVPAAGAAIVPGVRATAVIRGHVEIRNPFSATTPRPGVADLGQDPVFRSASRSKAVVYFDPAPQPAFEDAGGGRATLKQEGETFVPHLLAIRAGTVVDFPNLDPIYHNVFSLSKVRPFDLGRYGKGRSKSVRFDTPGIVRVFCDIHSHMNAFVLVFAHRFFAVTDDDGRYSIDGVPPGTYQLVAWYEGVVTQSRQVVVATDAATVNLDFSLR